MTLLEKCPLLTNAGCLARKPLQRRLSTVLVLRTVPGSATDGKLWGMAPAGRVVNRAEEISVNREEIQKEGAHISVLY